jgi:hypothetical protein
VLTLPANDRFIVYLGLKKPETETSPIPLRIASTIDNIRAWQKQREGCEELPDQTDGTDASSDDGTTNSQTDEAKAETEPDYEEQIHDLMRRLVEAISGYRPLIGLGMAIMPIYRHQHIKEEIYHRAGADFPVIKDDGNYMTVGVTEQSFPIFREFYTRIKQIDRAEAALPGAVLLSLVATFDSYVADMLRLAFRARPERFMNSDQKISIRDVLSMQSFDDAITKIIEDEVEGIMRGSHEDQISYIEKNFNLDIKDKYERWGQFVEIFERRNLAAHGELRVNSQYMYKCKKNGYETKNIEIGTKLPLTREYLTKTSSCLLEFGILLMFVIWRKQYQDSHNRAFKSINEIGYELIKQKYYGAASRILEFAAFRQKAHADESVMRMIIVNLANAYKNKKDEDNMKKVIESVDWSAAADPYRISIAALEEDVDRVIELMPRVSESSMVGKAGLREWAVFDWVRTDVRFVEKFRDIFGEDLGVQDEREETVQQVSESEPSIFQ